MRERYVVTVRVGPRVHKERFGELDLALGAIEARGRELSEEAGLAALKPAGMRRFEPVQRVMARIELAGPGRLRAGVDVRGDGSTEGYTGRWRRRLLDERAGESSYDALRRAVARP
ncbi:MAG: hypothetical protein KY396_09260 [Actinobacteria bacterium]|nr:hypothetical protein [Actinomycetota bacterium]